MEKTILILANSIRHDPNRCIAGREATFDAASKKWRIGSWIRPVSQHGEGEVSPQESVCTDGTQPAVLDIVTLSLTTSENVHYQPENYFIEPGIRWQKHVRAIPNLSNLAETPSNLWNQPEAKLDRVSDDYLASVKHVQSLYLIQPQNLCFFIWQGTNLFSGMRQKKRRAHFDYNGISYDLAITDPSMDQRYFTPFSPLNQREKEIRPKDPSRCLIVVSLGAKYCKDGNHYKLVATVIDY